MLSQFQQINNVTPSCLITDLYLIYLLSKPGFQG